MSTSRLLSILDVRPSTTVDEFFDRVEAYRDIDRSYLQDLALHLIRWYSGSSESNEFKDNDLERRWYKSLADGAPDYRVYDASIYISDVWACWICYSRKYLRELRKHRDLIGLHIGQVKKVGDVGCGFGYTTAALKQMFPDAEVIATNLEDTTQIKVARVMGDEYDFKVISDLSEIGGDVDMVFASEYFEHFLKPIDHFSDVLTATDSKSFVIANSFGTISVGHFHNYKIAHMVVDGKATSRMFNNALRNKGYQSLKTKMWNNKPSIWVRRAMA